MHFSNCPRSQGGAHHTSICALDAAFGPLSLLPVLLGVEPRAFTQNQMPISFLFFVLRLGLIKSLSCPGWARTLDLPASASLECWDYRCAKHPRWLFHCSMYFPGESFGVLKLNPIWRQNTDRRGTLSSSCRKLVADPFCPRPQDSPWSTQGCVVPSSSSYKWGFLPVPKDPSLARREAQCLSQDPWDQAAPLPSMSGNDSEMNSKQAASPNPSSFRSCQAPGRH